MASLTAPGTGGLWVPVATRGNGFTVVRVLLGWCLLVLREHWLLPLPGAPSSPPRPPRCPAMVRSILTFPDLLSSVLVIANPQRSQRHRLYQRAKNQVRFHTADPCRLTEAHPRWIPWGI